MVLQQTEQLPLMIGAATADRIRGVGHFADGFYRDLDVAQTLVFYKRRYVDQLAPFRAVDATTVIADLGAGYGWLAMAFALFTPARIVAVEPDAPRLEAGREIATLLGLAERIEWSVGGLGTLPLADASVDVAYCVEVLEHVGRDAAAVRDLARVSRDLVILTTPNLWFPVIAHDTRLPFCHWLPLSWRARYAAWFGRDDRENDNLFWSPLAIRRLMADYEIVSGFLHYRGIDDYLATFPFYSPYGKRGRVERIGRVQALHYRLASLLGRASSFVLPNLASVFRRVRPAGDGFG